MNYEQAFRANRRRVRGNKGRQLNRWRSERCERTFAHVCETGGGRRAWLRGQTNVSKAHTLKCAAYNLGLLLRKVWGLCKPRNAEAGAAALLFAFLVLWALVAVITGRTRDWLVSWLLAGCGLSLVTVVASRCIEFIRSFRQKRHFLTGCYGGLKHASAREWFDYISAIPEVEYGWVEWQAYEFAGRLLVPPTGWLPMKPRSTTSPRIAPKFGVPVEVFDAQRVCHGLARMRPEKTPAK